MTQVIDSDAVLAYVLMQRESVDMAFLRDLRAKLCPDYFIEIDSESVGSAIFLSPEIFAWENEGVVRRADDTEKLFSSQEYIEASYGSRIPIGCRDKITNHIQNTQSTSHDT